MSPQHTPSLLERGMDASLRVVSKDGMESEGGASMRRGAAAGIHTRPAWQHGAEIECMGGHCRRQRAQ
jgi:hypothetical protein